MNLLDRAKRLLQSNAADAPASEQSYHVFCPEGHRLSGTRTEGYQALRCPTCGEGIFVLPRSPLPMPPASETAKVRRHSVSSDSMAFEDDPVALSDPGPALTNADQEKLLDIDWEESEPKEEMKPRRAEHEGADAQIVAPRPQRRAQADRRAPGRPSVTAVHREPFQVLAVAWMRRHRNPLIFSGVVLVILGTVLFRVQRLRFEDYPRVAEVGRTEGLKALDEGRLDTAQFLLAKAKRAVVALGGKCEGADDILRGAAEAEIFANLVPEPLETLLEEADPADEASWSRTFATLYKGRTILIDAPLVEVTGDDGKSRYDLDYRIFPNGERPSPLREGRIDLTSFRLFNQTELKAGTRVQFGARLASFTYDAGRDLWLVGLVPDSGVFITHHGALKALWPTTEDIPAETPP